MWLFTYTGNATSTIRSFNFQSNFVIYDLSDQCRTHCYRISLSFHVLKLFKHPQLSSTIRGHEACPAVSEGVHHCHVCISRAVLLTLDAPRVYYSLLQCCSVSWWHRFFLYLSHHSPYILASSSYSQNSCYCIIVLFPVPVSEWLSLQITLTF